jgi:putative peptidoglycan lipid II flippase
MTLKVLKSLSIVGSMTLLSRISGLVRDVIFANILGDKAAADIFFVAFRIPNFFRRIFAEGAFSAAFIPVFTQYRENHSAQETNSFLQLMIGRLGLILVVVTILGVYFADYLVAILASGFDRDTSKFFLTVEATRITFPYLFFISFVAMAGGMLNTCGRFASPAATPILLNLSLISAALVLVPQMESAPIALAIGVLAAGVLQLLFQIPFLRKEKLTIRPRIKVKEEDEEGKKGVSKVVRLIVPAIFGVSVAQVNVIVNTILASYLITGSISWLYYSDRLMEFPVGVFGIALGTVILPHLSKIHQTDSTDSFSETLDWAARWVVLVCIPSTVGLILLAIPLVSTIYFHGDFTERGVLMTAESLIAYSVGMTAIVMVKVLAPGFYARQNTKTPVRIAMLAMTLNIVFCLLLIGPFKHTGLAAATTLSSIINASLLFYVLKKEHIFVIQNGWSKLLLQTIISVIAMGLFLWWFKGDAELWLNYTVWERSLKLCLLVISGGVIYITSLFILGIRPTSLILSVKNS